MQADDRSDDDEREVQKAGDQEIPEHCVVGVYPNRIDMKFTSLRFFSNFDSGNLLKVFLPLKRQRFSLHSSSICG